jgi:hypothetical protein
LPLGHSRGESVYGAGFGRAARASLNLRRGFAIAWPRQVATNSSAESRRIVAEILNLLIRALVLLAQCVSSRERQPDLAAG